MNRSLKHASVVLLACCALVLSSCSEKPAASIIGKWRVEKDGTLVEFRPDGTLSFTGNKVTMAGTYKFTDNSHLHLEIPMAKEQLPADAPGPITMVVNAEVKVSGDDLELDATVNVPNQPPQKDHSRLKRVK